MKKQIYFGLVLMVVACATGGRASDDASPPQSFASREEAAGYVARFFAGGRIDDVVLGTDHYIVIFQHGSGIPVLGFAQIYRRHGKSWAWVAKASIPQFEFAKAVALDGTIVAIGERTGHRTLLYAPKKA